MTTKELNQLAHESRARSAPNDVNTILRAAKLAATNGEYSVKIEDKLVYAEVRAELEKLGFTVGTAVYQDGWNGPRLITVSW
jgi:virulence-associated protein VapD